MSTALSLPNYDANVTTEAANQQAAALKRVSLVRFKTAGKLRIRFLPQGGKYLQPGLPVEDMKKAVTGRRYGTHFWPVTGGTGWHRFVCDQLTNGTPCPIDAKIAEYKSWKKKQEDAGQPIDPIVDKVIESAFASERHLLNAIVAEAPGYAGSTTTPVVVDLTKSQYEVYLMLLQSQPMLFHPNAGSWINITLVARQGSSGVNMLPMGVEAPSAVQIDLNLLADLDDVVASEQRTSLPAASFSGDFFKPVGPALAAPAPAAAIAPPPAVIAPQPAVVYTPPQQVVQAAPSPIVQQPYVVPVQAAAPPVVTVSYTPEQVALAQMLSITPEELVAMQAAAAQQPVAAAPAVVAPAPAPVVAPATIAAATPVAGSVNENAHADLLARLAGMADAGVTA